jgi:hypothetical protein
MEPGKLRPPSSVVDKAFQVMLGRCPSLPIAGNGTAVRLLPVAVGLQPKAVRSRAGRGVGAPKSGAHIAASLLRAIRVRSQTRAAFVHGSRIRRVRVSLDDRAYEHERTSLVPGQPQWLRVDAQGHIEAGPPCRPQCMTQVALCLGGLRCSEGGRRTMSWYEVPCLARESIGVAAHPSRCTEVTSPRRFST